MKRSSNLKSKCFVNCMAIVCMLAFIGAMMFVVYTSIYNVKNNPINNVIKNSTLIAERDSDTLTIDAKTDISVLAIESAASNAISSVNLSIACLGIFMTAVSISAAMIVYLTNHKLQAIDEKIDEFDERINIEGAMRHIANGIRYSCDENRYSYAMDEFNCAVLTKNENCILNANYYMGVMLSDRFAVNENIADFFDAESYLKNAIKTSQENSNIDKIIANDSYASLGGLYGLMAEINYDKNGYDDYLNKSEENLKIAIENQELSVYYKNLAVTYALKKDVNNSVKYFINAVNKEIYEKNINDENKKKENIKQSIGKLFNDREIELLSKMCSDDEDIYSTIRNNLKVEFCL